MALVDDSYTKLLLHFDGAQDSTTIVDENGHTINSNTAQLKTGCKRFGTSSGYYYNGLITTIEDHADWYLGTGDFTVDFQYCPIIVPGTGTYQMFYTQRADDSHRQSFCLYGAIWRFLLDSGTIDFAVAAALSIYRWYHVALVRSGNNWMCFQDGVQCGTTVSNSSSISDYAAYLILGYYTPGYYYTQGFIDEFRWSKGIARWTAAFTPPSRPYAKPNNYLAARRDRIRHRPVSNDNILWTPAP